MDNKKTQHRETPKALKAKNDYYQLGPDRSLDKLIKEYRKKPKDEVPTHRRQTLGRWSSRFNWVEFCIQQDLILEKERLEALKKEALNSGYALYFQRIHDLGVLAETLFDEITTKGRHWLPDKKGLGSGDDFEVVEVERFNEGIFRQFRGLLDDVASEMGERDEKIRLLGDSENPIEVKDISEVRKDRWALVAPVLAEALVINDNDDNSAD